MYHTTPIPSLSISIGFREKGKVKLKIQLYPNQTIDWIFIVFPQGSPDLCSIACTQYHSLPYHEKYFARNMEAPSLRLNAPILKYCFNLSKTRQCCWEADRPFIRISYSFETPSFLQTLLYVFCCPLKSESMEGLILMEMDIQEKDRVMAAP